MQLTSRYNGAQVYDKVRRHFLFVLYFRRDLNRWVLCYVPCLLENFAQTRYDHYLQHIRYDLRCFCYERDRDSTDWHYCCDCELTLVDCNGDACDSNYDCAQVQTNGSSYDGNQQDLNRDDLEVEYCSSTDRCYVERCYYLLPIRK